MSKAKENEFIVLQNLVKDQKSILALLRNLKTDIEQACSVVQDLGYKNTNKSLATMASNWSSAIDDFILESRHKILEQTGKVEQADIIAAAEKQHD